SGGHDPANRGAFPWHRPDSWDTELLHEFQRLIALRRQRPALRRGSIRFLTAADGVIAYARQLGSEAIVVIINASRQPRRIDVQLGGLASDQTVLEEAWTHATVQIERGALRGVDVAPRSGRVLATPP